MRIGLYALIGLGLWVALVWLLQRRVVFPLRVAEPPPGPTLAETRPAAQAWHRESPAGPVEAWFLPADQASDQDPAPSVIFAHGNAELIDHNQEVANFYHDLGLNVLLPEYRGYGRSAGSPSQAAIVSDFTAFYDKLIEQPEVDPKRIVFHGRSLGGGVVAQLATQREPDAWILESSFTSVAAMARGFGVPRFMVRDPFEVKSVVAAYQGPLLILHGTRDEVVPIAHARALHEASPTSTLRTYPVGHNEGMPPAQAWQDIAAFLQDARIID
jgi:fermentation-respiration switch protein FrsA (DUF1100 family)